ncbi:type II toxin-antitoxin system CcdA family antitoxin [Pseudomonas mohnii]|uniref:type II toxin-antitoxin system CcdA family antitoxin n=1 Tax=Pseudomonas mohnii TaxID=395600 RepID=UPI0018C46398|nr:type II toxin-antitoxin system CcdA family antitoxin [Pseudomonas mohnii]MBH8610122.1 type II toxin-antitoxin system CcdA family antitoxin [Pseudomonas mohnii]
MHHQEDIPLSARMEQNRAETPCTEWREQWLAENSEKINAYNEHVEAHGVFSDNVRSF